MAAVQQNGHALKHAPAALKNDKEVVMAAVQQDGYALKHASATLKNDKGVVVTAVQQNWKALKYAPIALINEHPFLFRGLETLSKVKHQLQEENAELKSLLSVPVVNVDTNAVELTLPSKTFLRESKKRKREATSSAGSSADGGPSVEAVLLNQSKKTRVNKVVVL